MASKHGPLFDIQFEGIAQLQGRIRQTQELLEFNLRQAVARTVLWGAGEIAEDTPVDTGLLRASIGGQVVDTSAGGKAAAEGKRQSLTAIRGLMGVIGTAVQYAVHQEFGWTATGPKKLTPKQLRFLFALGILRRGPGGRVIPGNAPRTIPKARGGRRPKYRLQTHVPLPDAKPEPKAVTTSFGVNRSINRRAGVRTHVKGKGFFRRNIPAIREYFFRSCEEAISLALQGKPMQVSV